MKTVKAEEKVAEETQGENATGRFITQAQFRSQLEKVDKTLRALPATAQVRRFSFGLSMSSANVASDVWAIVTAVID